MVSPASHCATIIYCWSAEVSWAQCGYEARVSMVLPSSPVLLSPTTEVRWAECSYEAIVPSVPSSSPVLCHSLAEVSWARYSHKAIVALVTSSSPVLLSLTGWGKLNTVQLRGYCSIGNIIITSTTVTHYWGKLRGYCSIGNFIVTSTLSPTTEVSWTQYSYEAIVALVTSSSPVLCHPLLR